MLRINNVTSGPADIIVTNLNGFSGGILNTPLTATQTSIQIPVSFNGRSAAGSYSLNISSPNATNNCNVTVVVEPCSAYKPTITTNVPTTLCIGDTIRMTASSGSQYAWNTGETTASILKKTAGNYTVSVTFNGCTSSVSQAVALNTNCEIGLCSGTLSPNSYNITFGKGGRTNLASAVAGATTTHIYSPTGLIIDGQYAVANNATEAGSWAANVSDHSGDGPTGRLMVINADNTPKECFRLPVRGLASNLKYQFSAWIRSISNRPEKPNVTLEIRDADTDSLLAIKGTADVPFGSWTQYGLTFITPTNPNLIVVLRNNTKGGVNGNDLVIDDIQFAYCGPPVVVTMQGGTFDVSTGDVSACAGKLMILKPVITQGFISNPVYQWQESIDNGVNWRDIPDATSLNYSFISDSSFADRKFKILVAEAGKITNLSGRVESNIVTYRFVNNIGTINGATTICTGDNAVLTATNGTSFVWNTGEKTATISKNIAGTYAVTITNADGCVAMASKTVTVNPRPVATITTVGEADVKSGGTATLTAAGGVAYVWSTGEKTPSISVNKAGTYTVTVTNTLGCSATATKTISILANQPPTVINTTPSVLEDNVLIGSVLSNVSDIDNNLNPNSFTLLDTPLNGTIQMSPNGNYTYTPRADFNGIDSVHYQVCDLNGACSRGTIIITVEPVNDPPKVFISTPLVVEDTPVNFCGTVNDKDLGDMYNSRLCNVTKGSVNAIINANQLCINYVPNKDFNGPDTICLLVCDKGGLCDTVIIPLNVVAVNDAPSLVINKMTVPTDSTVVQCFLITDPDPQDAHSATLCNAPRGNVQIKVENGTVCITYGTQSPSFDKDTLCVTLCDKAGACTKVLIPVSITPCIDKTTPTFNCPASVEVSTVGIIVSDPSGFIRLSTIADNCNGVNLDYRIPTALDDCGVPTVKQISGLINGGTFPKGLNALTFEAVDKTGKKATCRVEITISPTQLIAVDNVSACVNETLNLQSKVINLASYAWKGPQNIVSNNPSLDIPISNTNQSGQYILAVTMGKNCVFKDTVTVNINNAPKVVNDSFLIDMDGTLIDNVLKNDMVSNGVVLTLKTRNNTVNGVLDIKKDGTITYQPTTGFKGIDNFTYEVCTDLCPNICPKGVVILTVRDVAEQVYTANEVITPNGDNFNEALIIADFNVNDVKNKSSIVVYSQWGEIVYTASPYMNNWKGTFKDSPLPDGTYYYIFTPDPKGKPLKSFITIFR